MVVTCRNNPPTLDRIPRLTSANRIIKARHFNTSQCHSMPTYAYIKPHQPSQSNKQSHKHTWSHMSFQFNSVPIMCWQLLVCIVMYWQLLVCIILYWQLLVCTDMIVDYCGILWLFGTATTKSYKIISHLTLWASNINLTNPDLSISIQCICCNMLQPLQHFATLYDQSQSVVDCSWMYLILVDMSWLYLILPLCTCLTLYDIVWICLTFFDIH
jgi:hypothetical protein